MLLIAISFIFVGCASDEEKYIGLKEEVIKINDEFNKTDKEFKVPGFDGTKKGALELYKNFGKIIEKNEKVVNELEAYLPKIKEKLDKMEPLAKKKLELKQDFELVKYKYYDANVSEIEHHKKQIESDKKFMNNPKSFYSRSKATGFTDVPGMQFYK